mmetsp:Transcript_20367/g.63341  ORF Transcript_20367/g.63341 Transcript_20367/m.63341 type:complete len:161 (+) Transcript_20367:128-610(+)
MQQRELLALRGPFRAKRSSDPSAGRWVCARARARAGRPPVPAQRRVGHSQCQPSECDRGGASHGAHGGASYALLLGCVCVQPAAHAIGPGTSVCTYTKDDGGGAGPHVNVYAFGRSTGAAEAVCGGIQQVLAGHAPGGGPKQGAGAPAAQTNVGCAPTPS